MPNIRHYVVRILSVVIIYTLLGQCIFAAAPDAPAAIAGGVSDFGTKITQAWKSMDVSQYYDIKVPAIFTTLTRPKAKNKPKADAQFDRIEIGQRDKTVVQGEAIDFVATAYRGEQSVGGVAFRWSIRKAESGEARPLSNGRFRANVPGRYILQVSSGAFTAETNVTVLPDPAFNVTRIMRKPERDRTPADLKQIAEWNASGVLTTHAVSYTGHQAGAVGKAKSRPKAKAKAGDDANRINSVDPIGWDNTNYASAVAPVNWVGRPIGAPSEKGAANGNYNLSISAVNLDGRGDLGINLNLEYNSRLWSISGTEMTYNADSGYPAPGWNLGYGKMLYTGTSGGCIFVSPDGTRHSPAGSSSINTYGSVTTDTFSGYTTDGSMIEYGCQWYNNSSTSYTTVTGWAQLPNGTTMTFNSPSSNFDMTFPTRIVDRHGNYIDITYEGGYGPAIDTIVDTLGRTIDFNYNGTALRSISGPGYNGATRTFIRFEYFHQTIGTSGMFGSPITATNVANTTPYQIKAIFYPTTTNGYWFCGTSYYSPCGTDAYSPYGIIRTVLEQRGMNWNSGPDTIDWGTTNRSRVYNFPTSASTSYTDSPGYSTQVETFDGIDQGSPLTTSYSKSTSGSYETITVTRSDTSKLIQVSNISDGLQVENRIENSSSTVLDKVVTALGSGGSGDFYSPRPTSITHTDDKNQVTKIDFTYGTSVYNQVTVQKEYDYPGTSLYREKRFTYENGSSYTNRNIFSLVKSESVYDASNNRLSLTEYNYDQSAPIGITDAYGDPDAIVHLLSNYNPDTSSTTEVCVAYNNYQCTYEGETFYNGEEYVYCECTDYDDVSVYDYLTQYRGNVTEVITYADADASPSGAIDYDYTYDAAGNQRTTTTNCCQQIGSDYTVNTQYSMPASMTKGSSNPMSSERITQSYTYDTNTKIPTAITDFNGLTTTIAYDAVSRPTLVTLNSGGKKATTYNDSSLNIEEHVKKADNTTVSRAINYFNGRGQVNKTTYLAGASNWNGTQIKYDEMGRRWKVSRPYDTASSPSYWSEITYDKLSRPLSQIAPDGSTSTLSYNASAPSSASSNDGQTVTSADAWGRERWIRYDAFGRLAEAVEPNPTGSDGDVNNTNNINTRYYYDQLDRLTSIVQDAQTRSFAYDSLGRMIFQKLPEQEAYIDSAGAYNSGNPLVWSDKFEYDARSNLTKRTDSRGVVTTYDYTVSSSPDPLNRLQSISYSTAGADMTTSYIHPSPTVTFDYMTTGDKTRVKKVTTSGVATEENAFDSEGLIASYELKLNAHTGKPFKSEYTYDTAHRLTQIKYPKRYDITLNAVADPQMLVTPSYDEASRLSQMNVNSDMVNSDVILSDISYNTSGQVTSLKTATAESYPRVEGYTYDAATGLLTGQTVKNAALSSTYLDLSYSYTRGSSAGSSSGSEKTGQMTKITNNLIDDRDRKYEFDALGRLKYAKGGTAAGASSSTANWTQTYTYDRYGNKTATAVSGNSDENGNPVPADGLTSTSTSTSTNRISAFTYDRAGNLVRGQNASGVWQRYQYDAAGRLIKVQDDSSVDKEVFTYGAGRQKLSMTDSGNTTYYVWGGSSIIAEYQLVSSNPRYQKAYVFAGARLLMTTGRTSSTTEKRETHHPDRLGTKRVTNIDSGTEIEQSTLPFGTIFAAETSGSTNQTFTSYDRSSTTGLDYAINRTYSSGQGRFTTVDPIGMASASVGDPQSNNLYAYTQNMPTDFVDPSGLLQSWGVCTTYLTGTEYKFEDGTVIRVPSGTNTICVGGGWNTGSGYGYATNVGGGVGGGSRQGGNDCQRFARIVDDTARRLIDPNNPSSAGGVQDFMDALAQGFTEFRDATSLTVADSRNPLSPNKPNPYPNFSDRGFRSDFLGSASPNQVRHAVGGLIMGYVNIIGDSYAAQGAMALREYWGGKDKADLALNAVTMPMGGILGRAGGSKAALKLGDWIRSNLCAPVPKEGGAQVR